MPISQGDVFRRKDGSLVEILSVYGDELAVADHAMLPRYETTYFLQTMKPEALRRASLVQDYTTALVKPGQVLVKRTDHYDLPYRLMIEKVERTFVVALSMSNPTFGLSTSRFCLSHDDIANHYRFTSTATLERGDIIALADHNDMGWTKLPAPPKIARFAGFVLDRMAVLDLHTDTTHLILLHRHMIDPVGDPVFVKIQRPFETRLRVKAMKPRPARTRINVVEIAPGALHESTQFCIGRGRVRREAPIEPRFLASAA